MSAADEPLEARVAELTFYGVVKARCCWVFAKLRLADRLAAGPRTSDELARETATEPQSLYRVLRALSVAGVVEERDGRTFALTDLGAAFRSEPGSMRGWAEFAGEPFYFRAWADIGHTVETGRPAFEHVHGAPFFDYLADHADQSRIFDAAMTSLSANDAPAIVSAYDFAPFRRVADIGGGQGALLFEVMRRHPHVEGTLFDLPHVVEAARMSAHELGLADRLTVVSGDFFVEVPPADAYLLKFILHDWDDAACLRILESCRRSISAVGRLFAIELLVPPPGVPGNEKLDDVEMMTLLGSRERTEGEFAALFESAGFRLGGVTPTGWMNVIEAVPV